MVLPRGAGLWVPGYVRSVLNRRRPGRADGGIVDVLICIADHYEPLNGNVSHQTGLERVLVWKDRFPRLAQKFRDADGRPPQHTFFFPIEQYSPDYLDCLGDLASAGFGEVEVHLHHDRDTPELLRAELLRFADVLNTRHGLLSRDNAGRIRYAFIHGNWALDNSGPNGRWCGINNEIQILIDTGCYLDMTSPAAPSVAQTRTVNSIYYATDDPNAAKSHDTGVPAGVGLLPPHNSLLLLQGPLLVGWKRIPMGIWPRLENSSLHAGDPPTPRRMRHWVRCGIAVAGRPEWIFVKLHTHGAKHENAEMLLGREMCEFHEHLATAFGGGSRYRLHYVTAREMANIVHAAEAGESGDPGRFRDYSFRPPPCRPGRPAETSAGGQE